MNVDINEVSALITEELARSGLLEGLRPAFSRAAGKPYSEFIEARNARKRRRDMLVYEGKRLYDQGKNTTIALSEAGTVCALFTIACEDQMLIIKEIEAVRGNRLSGHVYGIALGFCHVAARHHGLEEVSAEPPYLSDTVLRLNERYFETGNILAGHFRYVEPGDVTPWAELISV